MVAVTSLSHNSPVRENRVFIAAVVVILGFTLAPGNASASRDDTLFIAASPHLERVLFTTRSSLVADDKSCDDIYLRDGNQLTLVSDWARTGGNCRNAPYPFTDEGVSTIAFATASAIDSSDSDGRRDVYVWKQGVTAPVALASSRPVDVVAVSGNGAAVFVATRASLTPDDSDTAEDIYRWEQGDLSLVTVGTSSDREVRRFHWVSESGSSAIFSSHQRLVAEDGDEGCTRSACDDIYLWTDDSLELVSTGPSDPGTSSSKFSGASPDGSEIYFQTPEGMTPDDTNGLRDLYRTDDGAVERITPDRVPESSDDSFRIWIPGGNTREIAIGTFAALSPSDLDGSWDVYVTSGDSIELTGIDGAEEKNRFTGVDAVSAELERITFSSREPLVNQDRNGLVDVYSWERESGRISLVSGGRDESAGNSYFKGASPSGEKVVFDTSQPLLPEDARAWTDPYVRDLSSGKLHVLSRRIANRPDTVSLRTVSVHRGSESVIVTSFDPLVRKDSDDFEDLYLLSLDQKPKLISAAP